VLGFFACVFFFFFCCCWMFSCVRLFSFWVLMTSDPSYCSRRQHAAGCNLWLLQEGCQGAQGVPSAVVPPTRELASDQGGVLPIINTSAGQSLSKDSFYRLTATSCHTTQNPCVS
jgi:hypothetical protein